MRPVSISTMVFMCLTIISCSTTWMMRSSVEMSRQLRTRSSSSLSLSSTFFKYLSALLSARNFRLCVFWGGVQRLIRNRRSGGKTQPGLQGLTCNNFADLLKKSASKYSSYRSLPSRLRIINILQMFLTAPLERGVRKSQDLSVKLPSSFTLSGLSIRIRWIAPADTFRARWLTFLGQPRLPVDRLPVPVLVNHVQQRLLQVILNGAVAQHLLLE